MPYNVRQQLVYHGNLIRNQIWVVIGVLIVLSFTIALIGYLSLRSFQAQVQTTLEEASRARELSLSIENEFLLARQNEADFIINEPQLGFDAAAAYITNNQSRLEKARTALEEMNQLAQAAHDPTLQLLTGDVDAMRPLLRNYEIAFLTTANAVRERDSASGPRNQIKTALEQLEADMALLPNPELRRLVVQLRFEQQAYFSNSQPAQRERVRRLANQLTTLLENSTAADMTTPDGEVIDKADLARRIENSLNIFNDLAALEQSITNNTTAFREMTAEINQVAQRLGGQSQAALVGARGQLAAIILQSTLALGLTTALAIGIGMVAAIRLVRRITHPLSQLSQAVQRVGQGDLTQTVTIRGGQELETLANAFNAMAGQLRQTLANLEAQVAERTRVVERRAAQIAIGAEIARYATTILNPEELIAQVAALIQERFGLYYVGVFLADADNRNAVLHYGTGEAGRIMKEHNHRLEIGGQSMVGWACAHKQPRIALDVGQDAVRFANPYLPDTHSEMALPLRAGERAIGALSVQSSETAAFDQDDVAALQGMADQIAVALENARLFQQTQRTLHELDQANRLLVGRGWQDYLASARGVLQAEFRAPTIQPTSDALPHVLQIPLELGQQRIGTLVMERTDSNRSWTEAEEQTIHAIAQQVVLAAENARLVEQTQTALRETEGLFQAAQSIVGTTEISLVCQNLAAQANELAHADRTIVVLANQANRRVSFTIGFGNVDEEPVISYDELETSLIGIAMRSRQAMVSASADDGIEPEEAQERRRQQGIGAMAVIPLISAGQAIGALAAMNRVDQRPFTQHDADLLMAVAAQATTAIENVSLVEESQRMAARERLINEITARIRNSISIEGVLNSAVREISLASGANYAAIDLELAEEV